ncbi:MULTISPECIES: DUF4183 domain-containing protein [Cohnella]|uniref:DUF4183 domain-containing protein n=1 Tax=Cohnella TaxID=329857 RepID=UPI0009BA821B|nr:MULTISPECIES: DUF4183 domain-containing protein [Cohnella]MBN2980832.1 DUF4183 domain-containing protein [Cohnella algarum]
MALQLMKLAVSIQTSVTVGPASDKFFYVTTAETAAGATLSIDAASFFDNTGAAVAALPALATDNSYFSVYVNGVLQMEGICTYTPGATGVGSLAIAVPAGGDPILADSPVVLEVLNFAPASTSTVNT